MVAVLREATVPDFAPQPGIADLERLARDIGDRPRVDVHLSGDLDDLPPSVSTGTYRIAREALTNAVRHGRNVTRVSVEIGGDAESVRLVIHDDGEAVPRAPTPGHGLLGMSERASLLGGTVQAGPAPAGGWKVEAALPKRGPAAPRAHDRTHDRTHDRANDAERPS